MQKKILSPIFILFYAFSSFSSFAQEPQNLDKTKAKLIHYHDSGEYQKDQAAVIAKAMEYLKLRLDNPNKKKLAIVLDIDETALSNYNDMLQVGFGGSMQEINDAEGKGTDTVIEKTLTLYRYATANHVAVFFVTGRTERYRVATEKNLQQAGYNNWAGLILKPEDYANKTAATYKINARTQIEKQGYDIVLNMGDQKSDLVGNHADKTFKLPNPYYLVP